MGDGGGTWKYVNYTYSKTYFGRDKNFQVSLQSAEATGACQHERFKCGMCLPETLRHPRLPAQWENHQLNQKYPIINILFFCVPIFQSIVCTSPQKGPQIIPGVAGTPSSSQATQALVHAMNWSRCSPWAQRRSLRSLVSESWSSWFGGSVLVKILTIIHN